MFYSLMLMVHPVSLMLVSSLKDARRLLMDRTAALLLEVEPISSAAKPLLR
jgi:hypothetical protein